MSTTTAPSKPESCTPPAFSPAHQATQRVADRLTSMVAEGKSLEAIKDLYADNARHVEVMAMPGCAQVTEGKAELLKKGEEWARITTIHSASCGKPLVNGDQFVCTMELDATSTEGPFANQRMKMSEICLYTVTNDKIVEGKFFYSCGM